MIEKLVGFALGQRLLIIIGVVALTVFGGYSYMKLPIDAFEV